MVKKLHKASVAYPNWKLLNNPNYKPWHFPEQIAAPRIRIEDVSTCLSSFKFYKKTMFYKHVTILIYNYDELINFYSV